MSESERSLAERAGDSAWAADAPGLIEAIAQWDGDVGGDRDLLTEEAHELARPGLVRPQRAARHLALNSLSSSLRLGITLPGDILGGAALSDPLSWARRSAVALFADQLASGGAPAAEIARLIRDAGDLFPGAITSELAAREISAPRLPVAAVRRVAQRAHSQVHEVHEHPVAATAISQVHGAELAGGAHAFVRVRRPGLARDLRDDARFTALRIAALERLLPQVGGMSPTTFVALTNRQLLEASDLRYEALGTVDLGLLVEDLGIEAIRVARPLPQAPSARALLLEPLSGHALSLSQARVADPAAVLSAIVRITLESAVTTGTFWADPSVDHLFVNDDGTLTILGVGAVGRLTPRMQRAGSTFLRSLLSGDPEGQVEAMRLADAIPPDADVEGLLVDLAASEALAVSTILAGGQAGLMGALNEAIRLLLAHRLVPPLEVVLLVRTLFALSHLSRRLLPDQDGLLTALLPLLARLPELLADDTD